MWISKKKWEKICEDIDRNERDILMIKSCHKLGIIINGNTYDHVSHHEQKVNTNLIKDVSLEELAKYVIDGTPIERDKTVKVKYHKGE